MSETTSMKGTWTEIGISKLNGYAASMPLTITELAVGDGNGTIPVVTSSQTALTNEVWRGQVNSVLKNPDNPQEVLIDAVLPFNVGNFWIREWGLFDADGDLVAAGPHTEFYKPVLDSGQAAEIMERIILPVTQEGSVKLTISSQALATQKFVQAQIVAHDVSPDSHADLKLEILELIEANKYDITQTLDYFLAWHVFKGLHPTANPGMVPVNGTLLQNASETYPKAFEYLQTPKGQMMCIDEASWQAAHAAVWATLADGSHVGWNNIGGCAKYVIDLAANTIRVPDLRGMYEEVAGFDLLGVGDSHGDGIPDIAGILSFDGTGQGVPTPGGSGALYSNSSATANRIPGNGSSRAGSRSIAISSARVVATANQVQPRAWGALACVYLGTPK